MEQPNWSGNILVFFKRGDQAVAYGGFRHNEPIIIIDPEQWVLNHGATPVFSDNNSDLIAFASLLMPKEQLPVIQHAIDTNNANKRVESGNIQRNLDGTITRDSCRTMGRILLDDSAGMFDAVRANWDAVGVSVPPMVVTQQQCDNLLKTVTASDLGQAPQTKDNNAWTSGSKTFGSGGNYVARSTMYADMGLATGDMAATQISDIVDIGCILHNDFSSYNYVEDGQLFKSNFTSISSDGDAVDIECTLSQKVTFNRIYAITNISIGGGGGIFTIYLPAAASGLLVVKNSKFTVNNSTLFCDAGFTNVSQYNGATTVCHIFNIMADGIRHAPGYQNDGGAGFSCYKNGASDLYENCVLSNCGTGIRGFDIVASAVKNTCFANNSLDALNLGFSFTNCATDKAALTGGGAVVNSQFNIVPANEFMSVDVNSPNAFKLMLVGGQLIGRGTLPSISDNTSGFYDTARPGRAGYVSIGADEPQLDETLLGVGLTSNGVASLGNDGTFSTNVTVGGGGYNNGHLLLGSNHLWVDSTGNLRVKYGAPGYDSDGTVIGSQS